MKPTTNHRSVRDIAVISTDLNGHITVFNQVAEKLLGYPAQEIIGKAIPIQNFAEIEADPSAYFNRPIAAHFTHANGESIELETLLSPIKNADGVHHGVLLTAHQLAKSKEEFSLSQLPDKHVLDIVLKREINRLQRNGEAVALLKIDVDHYTAYLQHYGEVKTHELLTEIAFTLNERVQRASDLLTYCDYDEFWALLPNTDLPGVVKVAEQLRLRVLNLAWPTHVSDINNKVTISVGIAHLYPTRETTNQEVYELADIALKEAKAQGRNCSRYKLSGSTQC